MALGHKTGGRQLGTPNKSTQQLQEAIQSALQGKDLVQSLFEDLSQCTPEFRADMKERLMRYLYPQRKAIEGSGLPANVDINLLQQITLILQMPREQLNELLKKSLIGSDQDKDPSGN